jgi:hypothetical protein
VRLRSSASAYFNRTPASAGNRKTWTWSGWVKRGKLGTNQILFGSTGGSTSQGGIRLLSDYIDVYEFNGTSDVYYVDTTPVYRDPAAWYHIVVALDTTQATSTNRVKIWVNGVQITSFQSSLYPTLNYDGYVNSANVAGIGANYNGSWIQYFDGYLTEVNFIDGQALTPSSFGTTNAITGVWQPAKYTGTYGTNGFYLNFSDNSSNTATTIGKDYSGNGNNWTPNNISVTAGSTYDSMTDVPTLTSATAANYCVVNPLDKGTGLNITNGNLQHTADSSGNWYQARCTFAFPATGKFYWELTFNAGTNSWCSCSIAPSTTSLTMGWGPSTYANVYGMTLDGTLYTNNTSTGSYGSSFALGDVFMVAFDRDNSKIYFGKNGTWFNSSNPVTQTNPAASGITTSVNLFPFVGGVNSSGGASNWGQQPFVYTPPTGYVALNTFNLPDSTIKNGAGYMAATTYTGNGGTLAVSNAVNGVSFQPDLVWIKMRSGAAGNELFDSIRGANIVLYSNATNAEANVGTMSTFGSGGFTAVYQAADVSTNNSGSTFVGWQWKAGGTSSSNTNGSITSTVSVGATQGFSVVTYTGTGANATVGHGLGVAPSMMIIKNRASVTNWIVYSNVIGAANFLNLNLTNASAAATTTFNSTAPTSSVFSIGTSTGVNASGSSHVAYCFAAVAGYSAFGSYTGNGSTDGPFVYLGFRPRYVMVKNTGGAAQWYIYDTARDTYNIATNGLFASSSQAETAIAWVDFLSNGFKLRGTSTDFNGSGTTYIYACFAENPFKNALAR